MLACVLYHQQMSVLYACDEMDVVVAELFVEIFYQHVALFCCEVAAMMILY